jgi:16S rRNA (guanine527-N7)-methyltransferase
MKNNNKQIEQFLHENQDTLNRLTNFMLEYNKRTNLTRITESEEIIEKHYVDSVLPLSLHNVPRGTIVLDVGSGAGFPGIPMKLFRDDLDVTLLDSAKKRTDYLTALLQEIKTECRVVTARSEELSHNLDFREGYGLVTARAVANLASLCEYCLPFVKVGGVFLAMKGSGAEDEVESAGEALRTLGGEVEAVKGYELPSGDRRNLVVIRKIRQAPTKFPRKRINIVKNPIA